MTRVVRIHEPGGPDALKVDDIEIGEPGAGQVRVRHHAIGVNYVDTYQRSGLYPLPSLPHGIGMEAAGEVEVVGPGVREIKPGDLVAYATGTPGAYAAARIVNADQLLVLPQGIDSETAAATLLKGLTVEYLIRRTFRVQPEMTVLWHAVAGGVGLIACQWLSHLGVRVIGTVGSNEKAALAREHGCAHTIVYTDEDLVARVLELTQGRGVPVVYDGVGKSTLSHSLRCLSPRGTLVSFGNASGKPDPIDPLELSRHGSLYLTRPRLFDYTRTRRELLESSAALFGVIAGGHIRATIRNRWPLDKAADAHKALEERKTIGSALLVPPAPPESAALLG